MIQLIDKFFTEHNFNAGITGLTVSFTGTFLQINNVIVDLDGILGLITKLFLSVVYIATAVWLITQSINLRDTIIEKRKSIKNGKNKI